MKKQKGQVWSIVKIDRYGKVEMGYQNIVDIPIDDDEKGSTLGKYIEKTNNEIDLLKKENKILKEQLIKLTAFINDFRKVTEKSFNYVVDEINKEKFL